ncbi:1-phosphofructokinase [Azomonas macrocytogenes]|uniref:Phosphofructokinase n=1 Tax=Azomonas macrocytogenes TaxID=69962 RepID=A0A839T0Y8_AZOMA|nr:1-phosphofructokinase [Azomonas macrocytogenes]MBB3102064.1 1-phosphofructokinase [Azomonas macrocytogenes]
MARILTITLNPALDLTVRLPVLCPGEVNRGEALYVQAAGKGLNVAQVLADLGHELSVTGFLGADNPQDFETLFAARGFHDAFVRVPGQTRSNFKLAESDGRVTDINGPGLDVSSAALDMLLAKIPQLVAGQEAVVVAGSLPRGVTLDWFVELLTQLKQQDAPLVLDTSGAALHAGLQVAPWLVKPNLAELAEACAVPLASPAQLAVQAQCLQAMGIAHLVVSQGAEGLCWFAPDAHWQARPPPVEVVSTVGAGDSLLAGMLHGLLQGWPAERTLRLATAVAAQSVGQLAFGIPDAAQLARLAERVEARPLAGASTTDNNKIS